MTSNPPDNTSTVTSGISDHLKERVKNFFRKGEHKLRQALNADLNEEDPVTDEVCIQSQTAAEFFLKTFILANKQKYKKYSHDIDRILESCMELDPSFNALKKACEQLQNFRGVVEYELGPEGFPSAETAEMCRGYAKQVKELVADKLKTLGF